MNKTNITKEEYDLRIKSITKDLENIDKNILYLTKEADKKKDEQKGLMLLRRVYYGD